MNTEIEKEEDRKEFLQITVPSSDLDYYVADGWERVSESTSNSKLFVTIRKKIR